MLNVMVALSIIGGALCSMPQYRCQYESARLGGRKLNFAPGKIPLAGNSRQKCIYSVAAQETAKHRAKFGWLPLSDVAAVTKPRRETR